MLGAPFVWLALLYDALPPELPLFRIPLGGPVIVASKSVFTVFRVPLMNLAHGLMAALMLDRVGDFKDELRKKSYSALFSTLLFAIALKSDFEALGIGGLVSPLDRWARGATAGTLVAVTGGLALALIRGRRAPFPWPELRLPVRDKVALVGLFASYVATVIASLLIAIAYRSTSAMR